MIIYLPCEFGEAFTEQKFVEWKDGKRIYKTGAERILTGFNAFDCITKSLAIPTIHTESVLLSYDHTGEFSQEYIPKYKILVDVKTEYKLSDRGFPSGKTGRLCGIVVNGGCLLADFVTKDRCEHFRYAIKDNLKYAEMNEEPTESILEFDKEAKPIEQENRQKEKQEVEKMSLNDLIKSKIKFIGKGEAE